MKKTLFGLAAGLLLFAGCSGDELLQELQVDNSGGVKTFTSFTATLDDVAGTRVHLENGNKAVWDQYERIGVFSDVQDVQPFTLSAEDNYTVFKGAAIGGTQFIGFYPYNDDSYIDDNNRNLLHFKVWAGINGADEARTPLETFMVAKTNNSHFAFKQWALYISL